MHSFVLIYSFLTDTFVIIERQMLKKSVRKISSSIYYLLCKQQVTNYSRLGGRAFVCYSAPHTVKWQLTYSLFWPNAKLSRKKCYMFSLQANIETWQNRNFSLIYVALVTWTSCLRRAQNLLVYWPKTQFWSSWIWFVFISLGRKEWSWHLMIS